MNQPVDILMAVYNGAVYLSAQLQSLFNQTYPYFHIYIRDDGSSDQTLQVIEAFRQTYPDTITVIPASQHLGVKASFSILMSYAKAPYIMFCDQDDIWLPSKIEESLHLMQSLEKQHGKQTPLLIHTDLIVTDHDLNPIDASFWSYSRLNPHAHSPQRLLAHNMLTGCTLLINQPLLQLAIPIPAEAVMHDWWLGLVATHFGQIGSLVTPTLLYRQHSKNTIGAKNWKGFLTLLTYIKKALHSKGRNEMRQQLFKTICQASHFLLRYEGQLKVGQKILLNHYVALSSTGLLKKRYLFLKHRFFKNTFAKNVGTFFFL